MTTYHPLVVRKVASLLYFPDGDAGDTETIVSEGTLQEVWCAFGYIWQQKVTKYGFVGMFATQADISGDYMMLEVVGTDEPLDEEQMYPFYAIRM